MEYPDNRENTPTSEFIHRAMRGDTEAMYELDRRNGMLESRPRPRQQFKLPRRDFNLPLPRWLSCLINAACAFGMLLILVMAFKDAVRSADAGNSLPLTALLDLVLLCMALFVVGLVLRRIRRHPVRTLLLLAGLWWLHGQFA